MGTGVTIHYAIKLTHVQTSSNDRTCYMCMYVCADVSGSANQQKFSSVDQDQLARETEQLAREPRHTNTHTYMYTWCLWL